MVDLNHAMNYKQVARNYKHIFLRFFIFLWFYMYIIICTYCFFLIWHFWIYLTLSNTFIFDCSIYVPPTQPCLAARRLPPPSLPKHLPHLQRKSPLPLKALQCRKSQWLLRQWSPQLVCSDWNDTRSWVAQLEVVFFEMHVGELLMDLGADFFDQVHLDLK